RPVAGATGTHEKHSEDHEEDGDGTDAAAFCLGPRPREARFECTFARVAVTLPAARPARFGLRFARLALHLRRRQGQLARATRHWLLLAVGTPEHPAHAAAAIGTSIAALVLVGVF